MHNEVKNMRMKNLLLSTGLLLTLFLCLQCNAMALQNIQSEQTIFETVDKVPVFKKSGGNVQKYLAKNLKYPIDALAKEIEGKVLVSFVVTSKGELSDIKIVKGLSESTNSEALRVVETMQDWKPGEISKTKVNTRVTIPVHFYLSDENLNIVKQLKPFYQNNKPPLFVLDNKKVLGLTTLEYYNVKSIRVICQILGLKEYYNVKSIRVIKGERAIALYGQDAKNGVLVIETKNGTPRHHKRH